MVTLQLPPRLTLIAWEHEVDDRDLPGARALRLDFGRVEYADFGALARALLTVDAAVRAGGRVEVVLPTAMPTVAEREHLVRAEADGDPATTELRRRFNRRARARRDARAFMRHIGFLDALYAPHWPPNAVQVKEAESHHAPKDGTSQLPPPDGEAGVDEVPPNAPYRPRRILPLQWLLPAPGERLHESESFHAAVARLGDLGMSEPGARVLSQTLLTELVENVDEHAGPVAALVGAILLESATFVLRRKDLPPPLGEVADCSEDDGGRVLRLAVGDAGHGLASVHDRSSAENVIFDALDKWSAERGTVRRGVRGLSRVATVVRGYRGSVVVRSSNAMAGLLYGRSRAAQRITVDGLGHAPGTLVEVNVLADSRSPAQGIPWEKGPYGPADKPLRWVECALNLEEGLSEEDVRRLENEAQRVRDDPGLGGIVVTVPIGPEAREPVGTQVALQKALDRCVRLTSTVALIVVVPDADRLVLDLAVSGLELDGGAAEENGPLLVIGAAGEPAWYGGPARLGGLLDLLLRAGGIVRLEEAERHWLDAGGTPTDFAGTLREHAALLEIWEDQLALRVSPLNAIRTLEEAVHHRLADAIDALGPGVEEGLYRGPTLRITNRWVNVDRLLDATVGAETAAFLLARKVEREVGEPPPSGAVMVRSGTTVARTVADRLSKNLLFGGGCHTVPGEFDLDGFHAGDRVPPDTTVVLCEDLLSTENTVRRNAAGLIAAEAEPRVIVCVVDAREVRGPVRILNRTIPIIALTDAEITPTGPVDEAVNIDPVLEIPQPPAVPADEPIPEAQLLEWCLEDPGTLRLGHIEGPRRMHFSVYLQLDRLLQHAGNSAALTTAILDTVERALAEIGAGDPPVQIWHPDSATESAGLLAAAVRERLNRRRPGVAEPTAVPRWPAGNRWTFPDDLGEHATGHAVVILDWGALSATTLRQMIRLAAAAGAESIVAVAVLNQLDGQDSKMLQMWRAVHGSASEGRSRSVPVVARFLGVSSLTGLEAHDCPMCASRQRYGELLAEEDTPGRLRRHAELLQEWFRPQDRREVSRAAAVDLFKEPVSGQDVADYLRWRGLLRSALRDTGRRQEVIERLHDLAAGNRGRDWTRDSLLRLLAAEQQWLKLPPLRFGIARDLLAKIDRAGLRRVQTESPWLRAQALTVLSVAAPQDLVKLLPELLPMVVDEAALVDHMLLECYRLLRRPPHDSPIDVGVLFDGLRRCRDQLEDRGTGLDAEVAADYVRVLDHLITIAGYRALPSPTDPQSAWAGLREDLVRPVRNHRLGPDLLNVRDSVELLDDAEPTLPEITAIQREWRKCARLLNEYVLTNLPALRPVLAGDFVADQFGRAEQRRLLELVDPDVKELRAFTEKLDGLVTGRWEPEDRRWADLRREVLDEIEWWHSMFLATHLTGMEQPSLLVDLVDSAPVQPSSHLATLAASRVPAQIDDPERAADTLVFCPGRLLDEVLGQLRDNVDRHQAKGAEQRIHARVALDDSRDVRIVVRNSGTEARGRPGNGVRSCRERLRPFGAFLETRFLDGGEWTFEAAVTLPRWKGAGR